MTWVQRAEQLLIQKDVNICSKNLNLIRQTFQHKCGPLTQPVCWMTYLTTFCFKKKREVYAFKVSSTAFHKTQDVRANELGFQFTVSDCDAK